MPIDITDQSGVAILESLRDHLMKERTKEVNSLDNRYRRQLDRIDEHIRAIKAYKPK